MRTVKPTDFAYSLTKYLSEYLPGQQGLSSNTILSYRDTFSLLLKYCKTEINRPVERLEFKSFDRALIENFLVWLAESRGNSIATRNQRLAALHAFFRYVQDEKPEHLLLCQSILSIPFKRKPKATVSYLSSDGIKLILSKPDVTSFSGRRDLVLLSLLYDTGARVQEIADITVRDVRLVNPATIRLVGKGNKARIVPLMSATADMLKKHIEEKHFGSVTMHDCPLFCNRNKQKLTRAGITYILNKYVELARLEQPEQLPDNITPHCFRHSKAMHLLQAGVNLVYIRDLLGHVDISTTEIYARADAEAKRKALENVHEKPKNDFPSWSEDSTLLGWLQSFGRKS
ncbi:site-specific integrase [Cohnella sp.]|uniref:site-specific integrase n=1 Tax=Cohnella sp. TaxID=1883426 RepID=UPI0035664955